MKQKKAGLFSESRPEIFEGQNGVQENGAQVFAERRLGILIVENFNSLWILGLAGAEPFFKNDSAH